MDEFEIAGSSRFPQRYNAAFMVESSYSLFFSPLNSDVYSDIFIETSITDIGISQKPYDEGLLIV